MTTKQYPAKYTVFWPGRTVHCCEAHYQGLVKLADAMGMPAPDKREESGNECGNCRHEAER